MKTLGRIAGHLLVLGYLLATAAAFLFTLARIAPPVGREAMLVSFAMMAPFQGYATHVYELGAEGVRADGTRQDIDLSPYYPTTYGERVVRGYLIMYRVFHSDADGIAAFQRISQIIRDRELQRGNAYAVVQAYWKVWPLSPDGLFTLRKPPTLTRDVISLD
ncbi:MAG TPA: hypothetical protein PKV72_03810 [Candidatus Peribacteria bacterium]|nr:hypothetical protein [Candidatus Peribacteria bacterium]